jgi:hypothetical protein
VEYLSLVRKLKVRRSSVVAKHGLELLNKASARSKLGSDRMSLSNPVQFLSFLTVGSHLYPHCLRA